MLLVKLMNLL